MKKLKKIVVSVIIASLFVSVFMPTAYALPERIVYLDSSKVVNNFDSIRAIAHRGFSGIAPENTIAAFKLAAEYGFYGFEFDIQTTSDGKWVIMHDEKVDRTTNGTGYVSKMTYAEIEKLHIDTGNNIEKYPNEKVPTLQQALDVCSEYGIRPVIEIKSGSSADFKSLRNILINYVDFFNILIVSGNMDYLKEARKLFPRTELWFVAVHQVDQSLINLCVANKIDGITFRIPDNDGQIAAVIKNSNLVTAAWLVDSVETAEEMDSYGIEYLTTNNVAPDNINNDNIFKNVVEFLKTIVEWFSSSFK